LSGWSALAGAGVWIRRLPAHGEDSGWRCILQGWPEGI